MRTIHLAAREDVVTVVLKAISILKRPTRDGEITAEEHDALDDFVETTEWAYRNAPPDDDDDNE